MKKAKGVFVNLILKLLRSIPAMILAAAVLGMAAYVVCVNVIPLGYCATAEFSVADAEARSYFYSDGFYSDVAEEYTATVGNLSPETAKQLFVLYPRGNGGYTLSVKTTSPEVSYGLQNVILAVAEKYAETNGGSYALTEADGIPTSLSRGDIAFYIVAAAVIGALIVLISAVRKGLALSVIGSEKEFTRVTDIRLLGTVPYSANPLTRHKPAKAKTE